LHRSSLYDWLSIWAPNGAGLFRFELLDSINRVAKELDYKSPSPPKHPTQSERIVGAVGVVSFLLITGLACLMLWESLGRRRDPAPLISQSLLVAVGVGGIFIFIRIWQGRIRL
jgi:hypothetical protein